MQCMYTTQGELVCKKAKDPVINDDESDEDTIEHFKSKSKSKSKSKKSKSKSNSVVTAAAVQSCNPLYGCCSQPMISHPCNLCC